MPDWLTSVVGSTADVPIAEMAAHLLAAFACGFVISVIYRLVRPNNAIAPTFPATLVMLAILCAMLPQIIGENVAWAFGLVGALSIVRFRTVIDDTKDIAFVIFAVLVGMAVGAGRFPIAGIGIVVVGAAAILMKPRLSENLNGKLPFKLTIRVAIGLGADAALDKVFQYRAESFEFINGATTRQGSSIDLVYRMRLASGASPNDLINEINLIEGVQNVKLQKS